MNSQASKILTEMNLDPNNPQSRFGLSQIWAKTAALKVQPPSVRLMQLVTIMWRGICASPLTFVVSVGTIALAFCLLASFLLVHQNLAGMLHSSQNALNVSVYLKDGVSDGRITRVANDLKEEGIVDAVSIRSREEALSVFRKSLAQEAWVLDGLEADNPLPISLEVKLKSGSVEIDQVKNLANRIKDIDIVEHVEYGSIYLEQINSLLRTFRLTGALGVGIVILMVVFVVANTIKLALYAHRDEIEIMRLVGATDAYVRAPYTIEGGLQGLLGGLASLLIVYGIYRLLRAIVASSEALAILLPDVSYLTWSACLFVLALSLAVGLLGSYITVRSFSE